MYLSLFGAENSPKGYQPGRNVLIIALFIARKSNPMIRILREREKYGFLFIVSIKQGLCLPKYSNSFLIFSR